MPALFDAHNHFQDPWLAPHRDQVAADLARVSLEKAVVNGTSEGDWGDTAILASKFAFVQASFGLHPWDVGNASLHWREALMTYLKSDPTAGVGEIGLDRWILDRAKPDDPRLKGLRRAPLSEQLDAFAWQFALAADLDRAATVHCIDAWGALTEFLRHTRIPRRGFLLHAYGGSAELAREFADRGAYFSFNGSFLGARQAARRAVFAALPLERLLVETDAPAMPLPPVRQVFPLPKTADGTPVNHPANIVAAYAGLAEIRGTSVENLAPVIEENFRRLFG